MSLEGQLLDAASGYAGHGVELTGPFDVPEVAEPVPLRLRAAVADDGTFTVDFGSATPSGEPLTVTVRAPDGSRLHTVEVDPSATTIRLLVQPSRPVEVQVEADPLDPALGPLTLRVWLIDKQLNAPAARRLVALYARVALQGREATDPPRMVLAADYTDAAGSVRLTYARARYATLEVELPGARQDTPAHPVPTGMDHLPVAEMRITAEFPPPPTGTGDDADDCGCHDTAPPHTPDQTDLVATAGVYSTDLGSATCPTPAVANRTIEEYRYYSLVRTTDPYLLGVTPKPPRPLDDRALEILTELAYGFGSLDAGLVEDGGATGGGFRPTGPRFQSLDEVRLSSERYFDAGLLTARAWRETAAEADPRKAILERAAALSDDALRHALADPDGFTPVSLMTAERFDAIERVRYQIQLLLGGATGRLPISPKRMPDWDGDDGAYQAATVAHGHLLEWRQVWRADGYSLGDLCYSLPLAPGQKRKIAVIDWDRDERSYRRESRTFTERFAADLSRNRTVSEVVASTVNESIDAGSSTNTWAAGGGIGLGIPFAGGFFGLGVAGGGGGASSEAWQNSARSLAATSGQQLTDRLTQASNAVRSQRASVVVGSEQSEGLSITSEVVANYNHCHAMTVEYFEILQHFRVDHELAAVRECLFVPLVMRPFDMFKALRWRDVLQPRLRRPQWAPGFDAIERILLGYTDTGYPPGRYADVPIRELWGEVGLELSIARPRDARADEDIDAYLESAWDFWGTLFGASSAAKAYDATIADRELADRIFAREYAPRVARAFCESLTVTLVVEEPATGAQRDETLSCDVTMVSGYRPGGTHLVSFRARTVPVNVTRAMVRAVRFSSPIGDLSPNSATVLRSATVQYGTDYRSHALVPGRWMRNDIRAGDQAVVSTRFLTRDEERDPRGEDADNLAGLLTHLNEYVEHYHQVIWWRMDPNRRFMLLDGFVAPNSGGRSLASVLENRLISIVGNALVMPVAPGYQLDPGIRTAARDGTPLDLLEVYRPPVPVPPKRIALPTRGVHAEAILGECNSCEIRDDTRFWDWGSEPIPNNQPTEIAEISTESRRQTPPDTTPTDLVAPVVAIQNAPAAPDPTPIGELAGLLATPNLFKDVTGLEGNQANAIAAFQQSLQTANAFGKMAASGAKAAFANRSGDRVLRKVQQAETSGLLGKDDAKQVVAKLFGVMKGETEDTDRPLTQEPTVRKALEAVNAAPGEKTVKVTSSTGSTSQTVEATTAPGSPGAAPAVDFRISGIPALQQPSPLTCWAVALTMLHTHARQQSLPVETVLLTGGEKYVSLFRAGAPLPIDQVAAFRSDFGLKDVSFGALTVEAVEAALRAHGPLWVVADEDASPGFSIHARVVTGIVGDGSTTGTRLVINDPARGEQVEEDLKTLADKLRQLSNGVMSAFGGVSPTVLTL